MADGGVSSGSQRAGFAALVVNIDSVKDSVDNEFRPRPSSTEDISSLVNIFHIFGLECINKDENDYKNLAVSRWDHRRGGRSSDCTENSCLRCRIKSKDHSQSKCFFLAFSSHGREITETEVMFSDGESVTLTEIFDALSDGNCPTLKGIPRVILLMVCRGNFKDPDRNHARQDRGAPLTIKKVQQVKGEEDGTKIIESGSVETAKKAKPSMPTTDVVENAVQQTTIRKMPNYFLLVYPAVSGQLNFSNDTDGTWLVHDMHTAIRTYMGTNPTQRSINFFNLLTDTARLVSMRESNVPEKDMQGKIRKNEKGDVVRNTEKSGLKNTVCSHHRLVEPLFLNLHDDPQIPTPSLNL